ncbi:MULTISPECIES: lytic transglycosylase domain-containing protein [unclassified Bradyrhizobium]|uniref:lytic transglycosylase domain-containing protein n=1 Tax=unclassified Bradyrhizobium TaxID=2631580 RepID=UPI00247A2B38|nr:MULTISPECIES: lytic transglycosylase domain-containing protein [unclassified Bradyrhizobium]WGR74275.1 lytic transglycosylase domain-containing protein [Bradyrhizobium sp. ISRA426]WGR79110.1 lytic transglycosylase domain-containing protein [Bradyrhizobium sp. ISRA430]WGR89514.1 lytic transglycosylase domain-containing protein [Bradyrhizobium sp. ISRA432]
MSVDNSSAMQTAGIDPSRARVAGAIKQASNLSGVSFEYMLTTAKMESDFNPTAGATTSSAHGLYQFIDQTWLGTVKEAGAQLGYGSYADAITKTLSGSYTVDDPVLKRSIMELRDDPEAASSMAAALTQSNSFKLTGLLGRRPSDSELYMAHFMGVGGAAKLIANAEDNPQAVGARLFPNAAAANRSIFYAQDGRARSISEVYSVLNSRYASAANSKATRSAMAMYGDTPSMTLVASTNGVQATPVIDNAAYLQTFPDTRAVTPVSATSTTTVADNAPTAPAFRSIYQPGDATQPVSTTVQKLWGNNTSPTSVASAMLEVRPPQPLDLFSDRSGTFSS